MKIRSNKGRIAENVIRNHKKKNSKWIEQKYVKILNELCCHVLIRMIYYRTKQFLLIGAYYNTGLFLADHALQPGPFGKGRVKEIILPSDTLNKYSTRGVMEMKKYLLICLIAHIMSTKMIMFWNMTLKHMTGCNCQVKSKIENGKR